MLKKAGIIGAATGALAAGGAAGLWWQLFRRSLPATEGTITVSGPGERVEIRRDRWGVPHVHAREERDVWFGQGFCHGQDRLWQLDLYRRVARGRLSEIAGPEALPSDRFLLSLGMARIAEAEAAALDPEVRDSLRAFCAGINAAVNAAGALPAELQILRADFEPWTPADSLAAHKLLSFGLSTNWERELLRAEMARELGPELAARLDPTYPAGNPVVLTPGKRAAAGESVLARAADVRRLLGLAPQATGSNNWAVAPSRSATGSALVAGDPHLPPSMPGITYQIGLYAGGRFGRGGSLPGMPGLVFGQNNDVAWTFTNVMADVMDLFVERLDGDRYLFEDEWRDLELSAHEIPVRGADPDRLVVRSTHHGPLVNEALRADDSEPLALSWMPG